MQGRPRTVDPSGPPGITLHTSQDGGVTFKAACLPVALRVGNSRLYKVASQPQLVTPTVRMMCQAVGLGAAVIQLQLNRETSSGLLLSSWDVLMIIWVLSLQVLTLRTA
jgi:hypothetical protein